MEMSSVLKFLENKSILVTGGAGFLAKIFAEKVLRCQPNVKKVYLLIRAADKKSASLRLQNEVIGKALFKVLKQKMGSNFNSFISEKIKVVPGDITCEDLGIKESNIKEEILKEVDVIVNLAATTNFDERYDVSLYLNTFGAKYVLDFAKKCTNLKNFLHVSTAYVSGEMGGLVKESPYSMGESLNGRPGLNIEFEKTLIDKKLQDLQAVGATNETIKHTMRDMGLERAKQWGWPNVYVFTKALGEMLIIQEKGDIPLVIVRPTIVTSTFKEPFPGWVEGVRTIDSLAVAYGKGRLPCFVGDPDSVVDVIPADMVCNAMLVAAMIHANEKGNPRIYQVGSSVKNPTTFSNLHEVAYQYFQRYPWINKDNGKPIRVGHVRVLGSMDSFNRYLTLYYLLPLKALELANIALCQSFRGTFLEQTRKINYVKRLIDIYKPYLFFKGIYDDSNTEKLREAARNRGVETDIFYFDPKAVHWEDYFMNTHLPGLVKYVFK